MTDKDYYISTDDTENGGFIIYNSEKFKLSEIDLINIIKICLVEQRNKGIGNRLLDAYIDSTSHRKEITQTRLNLIGIKQNGEQKPENVKRARTK